MLTESKILCGFALCIYTRPDVLFLFIFSNYNFTISSAAEGGQINNTSHIEESMADSTKVWKCNICNKVFDSWYILNYHKLLEHSESKRPPIGIG